MPDIEPFTAWSIDGLPVKPERFRLQAASLVIEIPLSAPGLAIGNPPKPALAA